MEKYLPLLLAPVVHVITLILPKNKNKWCFGAWFGKEYSDNPKYLFEIASEDNSLDCFWITKDKNLMYSIRAKGFQAYYTYSIEGVFHQLRSYVFISNVNSKDFYFPVVSFKNIYVQTWHGSPLKKIGFDVENISIKKKLIRYIRRYTTDNYTYILSPSAFFDTAIKSAFKITDNQLIRSSYPRCDGLFINNEKKEHLRDFFDIKHEKLILYLPTHRDEGATAGVIHQVVTELIECESYISNLDCKIIFKPHGYDMRHFSHVDSTQNVCVLLDDANIDLYELLSITDILITDYSSVMFDFDMLDRPIVIHAPDLDHYKEKNRDMYFDFDSMFLNYSIDTVGLIDALIQAINFSETCLKSTTSFNERRDGDSSKMLLNDLLSRLYRV